MGSEKYVYFSPGQEQIAHLKSLAEMAETGGGGGGEGDTGDTSADDLMVARVSAESPAHRAEKMRLVIDSSKIRLFDPETEQAIL
jgi:hypothetical protein